MCLYCVLTFVKSTQLYGILDYKYIYCYLLLLLNVCGLFTNMERTAILMISGCLNVSLSEHCHTGFYTFHTAVTIKNNINVLIHTTCSVCI